MINKNTLLVLFLFCVGFVVRMEAADADWQLALPGWQYQFPVDHAIHRDFKTEWWYFTGNLHDEHGHAFGYELTFFRQGVIPPPRGAADAVDRPGNGQSRFVQNDFKFAHFAISDLAAGRFVYTQKMNRGAFGEAGFGLPPASGPSAALPERLAWMEDWKLQPLPDGSWRITAHADTTPPIAIDLTVSPRKPPVIEGTDGVSQKAAGPGNASHYYSYTRLQTTGVLRTGGMKTDQPVSGESWFDHEWASNQLAPDQVGWDWFCFQFDDQTELMLYAMRRRDGSIDPFSSGTLVHPDGTSEHLAREQFAMRPLKTWQSRNTGALYPIGWQVSIPSQQLDVTLQARLDNQELVLPAISYWEGAVQASGRRAGREIHGVGYMELTGYAAALKGLQQSSESAASLQKPTH